MAEYMSKEVFLSSMGLTGDETKYGNRDAEHQHRSYSTYMSYEIMDSVDDSIVEEELAPVRHGHWNAGYFHDRVCSCCLHPDNDINDYAHSYCPNCGAQMDEKED